MGELWKRLGESALSVQSTLSKSGFLRVGSSRDFYENLCCGGELYFLALVGMRGVHSTNNATCSDWKLRGKLRGSCVVEGVCHLLYVCKQEVYVISCTCGDKRFVFTQEGSQRLNRNLRATIACIFWIHTY